MVDMSSPLKVLPVVIYAIANRKMTTRMLNIFILTWEVEKKSLSMISFMIKKFKVTDNKDN